MGVDILNSELGVHGFYSIYNGFYNGFYNGSYNSYAVSTNSPNSTANCAETGLAGPNAAGFTI